MKIEIIEDSLKNNYKIEETCIIECVVTKQQLQYMNHESIENLKNNLQLQFKTGVLQKIGVNLEELFYELSSIIKKLDIAENQKEKTLKEFQQSFSKVLRNTEYLKNKD